MLKAETIFALKEVIEKLKDVTTIKSTDIAVGTLARIEAINIIKKLINENDSKNTVEVSDE